ncbi:MAG: porin, partial [Bacteroidaceae bacterium]|nr:porin [Bacteroidaceae bacterium]
MKKHLAAFCGIMAFFLCTHVATAQEESTVNLRMEARGDLQYENFDGHKMDGSTGFRGKQFNLRLDGNITEAWSYSYRQRMGKPNGDASYFDAVDWINLTYTTGAWAFSGGKQVVAVGGYEYDRAPLNFYFGSEFWNNMACYQWGVSASYNLGTDNNDVLKFQVAQSSFRSVNPSMLSYNLMWTGSYGCLDILHSVNMLEYLPGKFVSFIALGHQFHFDYFTLQLDWMNRADVD